MSDRGYQPRLAAIEAEFHAEQKAVKDASKRLGPILSLFCVAGLLVFMGFQVSDWAKRNTRPPAWDQSIQLEISLDLRDALARGDLASFLRMRPKPGMPPFPPLYALTIQGFGAGADAGRALWANWLHLVLLGFSIWGISRRFMGPWRSAAAAVCFLCMPVVQDLLRDQLSDLALTAWVAAVWWAYFESRRFARAVPTVLAVLAVSGAMLMKWSAFSYLFPIAWAALDALRDPLRRRNAAGFIAGVLILCAPWYLLQWPVLLPRLVQASSDSAVPVWQGLASLGYLFQMAEGLDLPLFLLGVIAVAVPAPVLWQDDSERKPLLGWFLLAYIFWMIVPNRQLRYLLPGLPPVAILCAMLWPRPVMGFLCAFQIYSAANYSQGWIGRIFVGTRPPISLFNQRLPPKEDWKLEEMLRFAEASRDRSRPFANMTVVGNHPAFNGPTFNWVLRKEGLQGLYLRGVNRRLCEFSEFVLVKTGSLGPSTVIGGLEEARQRIFDQRGWFQNAYREVRRVPLPDGSEAVLFQQKRFNRAPIQEKSARFDYYEAGDLKARGLRVEFGAFDSARGMYPKVRISADQLEIRGLPVRGARVEFEDALLVPVFDDLDSGIQLGVGAGKVLDVRLLRMSRLRLLGGEMESADIAAFLVRRAPGLERAVVRMEDGLVSAAAVWHGIRFSGVLRPTLAEDHSSLALSLERLRVAGFPIPTWIFGRHAGYVRSAFPDPELPFEIELPSLRLEGDFLKIG
ncbi:MAG: glycosyltransferase family 39 protein [Elusimicrobiota bacterium]|jgi:hypothetical protein